MLLACVLVGEYFSEKEEIPTFYVRNGMEWERNIEELTAEEIDKFNFSRCSEYCTFLILCTILSSQVQVNDKIARRRTSMGPITVKIIMHGLL
jgi:hypothetical protein